MPTELAVVPTRLAEAGRRNRRARLGEVVGIPAGTSGPAIRDS
ncbi:hypothetical protein [Brevibacterium sp. H-BE7]|nr:hypothetical protein [Brevibacterium sp. H-BE7]MDK8435454.1 hypothetical protein [Brevibacterium sp. H-BE7]